MTTLQRICFWMLAAYCVAAVVLVQFVIYGDTPAAERLVYTATVAVYGAIAVLGFRSRPGDPRVRLFVVTLVCITLTWVLYPFPPTARGTLPSLAYAAVHTGIFVLTSALLLHIGALLPERGPIVRRWPEIIRAFYWVAAAASLFSVALYLDASPRRPPLLPWTETEVPRIVRQVVVTFYGIAALTGSLLVFDSGRHAATVAARRQAVALWLALFPFGVLRLASAVYPDVSRAPLYPTVETLALLMIPLGLFLAVHGFRMFELRLYLRRGILLATTLALLTFAAFLIVLTARISAPTLAASVWTFALVCVVAGAALLPVARHLGTFLDTMFFPERVAVRSLTVGILRRVAEYTDVRALCAAFAEALAESLALESAAVYVVDETGSSFELAGASGGGGRLPAQVSAALAERVVETGTARARKGGAALEPFARMLPISLGERMYAVLALGPRPSGEALSAAELHEVELATLQVAAMIENARLFSLATRDSLTGLVRRAVFEEHLRTEAARFSRGRAPFSVLLIDVDDFKRVNDRFGHAAGDEVLRAIAGAVRGAVRESDTVSRYGGEELAVLLPDTEADGAAAAGDKLRAAVAALAVEAGGESLRVTVSVGAAEMEPGLDPARLVARADDALYRAKSLGKNRVELHRVLLAMPAEAN
jgi:diguanylate cyclase (GGDEF)-like protein